jgi:hypothetical protein
VTPSRSPRLVDEEASVAVLLHGGDCSGSMMTVLVVVGEPYWSVAAMVSVAADVDLHGVCWDAVDIGQLVRT